MDKTTKTVYYLTYASRVSKHSVLRVNQPGTLVWCGKRGEKAHLVFQRGKKAGISTNIGLFYWRLRRVRSAAIGSNRRPPPHHQHRPRPHPSHCPPFLLHLSLPILPTPSGVLPSFWSFLLSTIWSTFSAITEQIGDIPKRTRQSTKRGVFSRQSRQPIPIFLLRLTDFRLPLARVRRLRNRESL